GATTENPSFALNAALLSRARTYVLRPLAEEQLVALLQRAVADSERGLGGSAPPALDESAILARLAAAADGDARRALTLLELAADTAAAAQPAGHLGDTELAAVLGADLRRFDRAGDLFHDQVSALHKAVRGSAPDAA